MLAAREGLARAGETAKQLKGLLHRHEDPSSNLQNPCKELGVSEASICNPRASMVRWVVETGEFLKAQVEGKDLLHISD